MTPYKLWCINILIQFVRMKERMFSVEPSASLDKVLNVGKLHLLGEIAPTWFVMSLCRCKLCPDTWTRNPCVDNVSPILLAIRKMQCVRIFLGLNWKVGFFLTCGCETPGAVVTSIVGWIPQKPLLRLWMTPVQGGNNTFFYLVFFSLQPGVVVKPMLYEGVCPDVPP